jgi:hypothetical protein
MYRKILNSRKPPVLNPEAKLREANFESALVRFEKPTRRKVKRLRKLLRKSETQELRDILYVVATLIDHKEREFVVTREEYEHVE